MIESREHGYYYVINLVIAAGCGVIAAWDFAKIGDIFIGIALSLLGISALILALYHGERYVNLNGEDEP